MSRILIVMPLILVTASILAQVPVQVLETSEDSVGQRLTYNLKEQIRESRGLQIARDLQSQRMQFRIVTLDQNPSSPGNSTVYSAVTLWANPNVALPVFLDQQVGYCGSNRVDECAEALVASISKQADQIIAIFSMLHKQGYYDE